MQRPLPPPVEQATRSTHFDEGLVAQWVEHLDRDPDLRALVGVARRCGVPLSVVLAWSADDLAAERAMDIWDAADSQARCSSCGVHPDELDKPGGRAAVGEAVWKLDVLSCDWCEERHDLEVSSKLKPWQRVVTRLRGEGEPVVPG